MHTETIRAKVGDKIIKNAAKFYQGTTKDLIDEIVANARRAKATTIVFTHEQDESGSQATLVVQDDGNGLAADQAHILLTFGGSANDEETEVREDAAGIGFFSMAQHDVRVRSRDWCMTIPKGAFTGDAEALLTRGLSHVDGLELRIANIETTPRYSDLADGSIIRDATRYCGLTTTLRGFRRNGFGSEDQTYKPERFLDIEDRRTISSLTESRHGVTVHVAWLDSAKDTQQQINFFGKVLDLRNSRVLSLPCEGSRHGCRYDHEAKQLKPFRTSFVMKIDVERVGTLRMVLPARNDVYANAGALVIQSFINEMMARLIRGEGRIVQPRFAGLNTIPMRSDFRHTCAAMGLPLPPPSLTVAKLEGYDAERFYADGPAEYAASERNGLRLNDGRLIAFDECITAPDSDYLRCLLNLRGEDEELLIFSKADVARAYGDDVEAFGRLDSLDLIVRTDDDETEFNLDTHDLKEGVYEALATDCPSGPKADGLALRLNMRRGDGRLIRRVVTLKAVPYCPEYGDAFDVSVIVTDVAHVDEVVYHMINGLDWYDEDHEANNGSDQLKTTSDYYESVVREAIGDDMGYLTRKIQETTSANGESLFKTMKTGETVTITVRIQRNEDGIAIAVAPSTLDATASGPA